MKKLSIFVILVYIMGCCGTYYYKLKNIQEVKISKKLPGSVHLNVSGEKEYIHLLGCKEHHLYIKSAIERHYIENLNNLFEIYKDEKADTNIIVTVLDTSFFPIAGVLYDIRIFLKVEIFDKNMEKQKTVMIYGFGSDSDGNRALEKAVSNSFFQLMPILEELFIRD